MLATVPSESGHAVWDIGGLPDRVRNYVSAHANAVIAVSVPVLLLSFAVMVWSGRAGIGYGSGLDYQVYRWAVHTWLSGGDIMNSAPLTSIGRVLPWVYPPFALLPLMPFSLLSFISGLYLLYVLNLATVGVVLYLVLRRMWPALDRRTATAMAAAILPFTLLLEPIYACFGLAQVNILLMGLVAIDCLTEQPRWPRGLLVGIAAAIKLTPAAFLLFFLVRKDVRAAVTAGATAVMCTLLGFLLNFEASMDYWFHSGPAQGVGGSTFHTNQAIMGGLARLGLPEFVQGMLWFGLAVAAFLVTVNLLRHVELPLAVVVNGLFALLVSPTSWSDHWVWVAPGLLVMVGYAVSRRSVGWLAAAVATTIIAMLATFRMLPEPEEWNLWQHVVGNSYLLLGLVLLGMLARTTLRRRSDGTGLGAWDSVVPARSR